MDSRFESRHLDERNEPFQSISNAAAKVQTGLVMIESGQSGSLKKLQNQSKPEILKNKSSSIVDKQSSTSGML